MLYVIYVTVSVHLIFSYAKYTWNIKLLKQKAKKVNERNTVRNQNR